MEEIVITCLADLRIGDRIISRDGHACNPPWVVTAISRPEAGSPREGVRLSNPADSWLDYVLKPSQMEGRVMEVLRY